ncbi:MAG: hypothetical protein R3B99_32355 [Polyangiales bacterium]
MHLGFHVYALATQSPDVDAARPTLFATVLVLLGLAFALNLVANLAARARLGGWREKLEVRDLRVFYGDTEAVRG